jgi:hypothetical protein
MKRVPIAIALLAAALAVQPLTAAAQATADKPAAKPRAGMQMDPKLQQQMMERMKTMRAQMDKIHQTTDPKEREKLMAEHMKTMQEGMQMMQGMGGGMMGGGAGGGMMGGGQGPQMMEDGYGRLPFCRDVKPSAKSGRTERMEERRSLAIQRHRYAKVEFLHNHLRMEASHGEGYDNCHRYRKAGI